MAINGPHEEPVVTQLELAKVAMLQASAWNMHTEASVASLEIRERVVRGAPVEPGAFYYDVELNLVRGTRTATAAPPQFGPPRPVQGVFDFDGRKEPESAGPIPPLLDREVGS